MIAGPKRIVHDEDADSLAPRVFIDFVEKELGPGAVAAILEAFGGHDIYVPQNPQEHHALCKVIGVDNVKTIGRFYGEGKISLPLKQFGAAAVRRAAIKQACREGRTTTSIVKEFRASARTVHKIRARLRREEGLP